MSAVLRPPGYNQLDHFSRNSERQENKKGDKPGSRGCPGVDEFVAGESLPGSSSLGFRRFIVRTLFGGYYEAAKDVRKNRRRNTLASHLR
jgi:hypothetical protein